MGFEDLANFATRATISLPISGKIYVVNDVDAETGTWASLLANMDELGPPERRGRRHQPRGRSDPRRRGRTEPLPAAARRHL
jgi:hypothetical protein